MVVTVAPIERVPRDVNGSQDIFDLREFPLLNVLPLDDVEVCSADISPLLPFLHS